MYPKGNLFIPASHGQLEAIIKEPVGERRGVGLVCHPHPLGGGTMHNKVVFRVAAGLVDAGVTTLRFNFRGVGASTGVHDEIEGGREDVSDALGYLAGEFPDEDVTLAGFSFGSRTGMEVGMSDDRVNRLISIGTPVEKYRDYDFLTAVKKPILFIHGDKDEFCSVESLRSLTDRIAHAEVVIFENCGHFFDEHLSELRNSVRDWTERKISRKYTQINTDQEYMGQEDTRDAAIRLTMMPRDTNAHGTVFGGVILSYIDVAGGVEAIRHTRHNRFVTVAMKEVIFHEPVFIGDLVSFYAKTLKVGNTSITIHVDVEAERFGTPGVVVKVTEAEVIFVAIDEKGTKIAIGK